ncbi:unnamed protein product [Schistocephalus solidus]|uniref:Queuosine 5'-phosphate N-glycosylase/hydrolase n=1 Tax=Schistocephalus solidus TaxID=70667 RepID=A0A183SXG0_SCHSO|nr:unnamed protein product [Schistocephalus solidus]
MGSDTVSKHLSPRESAKFITEHADHVKVNSDAIQPLFYDDLKTGTFDISMHPKTMDVSTVIFLVDSLNFSFWTETVKYVVSFRGETHTGYMALCAAVNRALEEGIDLLDAHVLANLTLEQTKHIFRSATSAEIPLLETRHQLMLSNAETLLKKYNGCFSNCLTSCKGSAADLLELVTRDFPSFDDRAVFKDQPVTFWKRAQILVADLWLAFKGQSFGYFKDIDSLTAFADYRVPQVLAYFGVLEYDSELRQKLDKRTCLHAVECVAVTVAAFYFQLLVGRYRTIANDPSDVTCSAILADKFLWLYRRAHEAAVESRSPMHRTRCIYY